jgi:hypothetical protein
MARPTAEEIAKRGRGLAVDMEVDDEEFPELGGQKGGPQNIETGKPENRETVKPPESEEQKKPPVAGNVPPVRAAEDKPKTPRKRGGSSPAPEAAAAARGSVAKPVTITISIPPPDARRSRDLENHIYDNRDTIGLKGKIGPSLIFKMGLDLLESLSEDDLFSYARKNATYQQ